MSIETMIKLGSGVADVDLFTEVLSRAGRPTDPPPENWELGTLVRMLDYVPKNKPFLIGDPTIPSETQSILDVSVRAGLTARWLLREFAPCIDPRYEGNTTIGGCFGCATDNIGDFGRVYSSKTSMVGFVEGIVSSLANWKLYAFGLKHYEWTDELTLADPLATYSHPLRPNEDVPAGTVIHTAYCAAHLVEWYNCLRNSSIEQPRGVEYRRGNWLERLERGVVVLNQLAPDMTTDGAIMLDSMLLWYNELLRDA